MWTTRAKEESDEGYKSTFNLEVFSDRVMRIEIVGGSAAAAGGSPADSKRRREEDEGALVFSSRGVNGCCVVLVHCANPYPYRMT
jgi:hypothetical protein